MVRSPVVVSVALTLMFFAATNFGQDENLSAEPATHDAHASSITDQGTHRENGLDVEPAPEEPEMEPPRENFLIWFIGALGWKVFLALPTSALFAFVLVAILLARGKGSHLGAAMAFLVAMPFLIGLFGMFDSLIAVYMVLSRSTVTPRYDQIAHGISISLVAPITALFLMVPSYLLATVGLTIRALKGDPKP